MDPDVARTILLNQENNFKDTLEVKVYNYAKRNSIKPLGFLIRSWARATHDLSLPSNLLLQNSQDQARVCKDVASSIGSLSTLKLTNDNQLEQSPLTTSGNYFSRDANNYSTEVTALGEAIKKADIKLVSNLIDKKTDNFSNRESAYLRQKLSPKAAEKSLITMEYAQRINILSLAPSILGAGMALAGKYCKETLENNNGLGLSGSLSKNYSNIMYYGGLATALSSSILCLGSYALWKYSSRKVEKNETIYKAIHTLLTHKES